MVVRSIYLVVALSTIFTLMGCWRPAGRATPHKNHSQALSLSSEEKVKTQAEAARCAVALFSGDVDAVIALTHPKLIEAAGGEKAAREQWKEAIQRTQLTSFEKQVETSFPSEPVLVRGTEHEFVIVPLRVEIKREGMKAVEQLLFPVGIRRRGDSRWRYTDGASTESMRQLFPDFPPSYDVPEASIRVLD